MKTEYWPRVLFVSVTSRDVFHLATHPEGHSKYSDVWVATCDRRLTFAAPMGVLLPVSWALELGGRPCHRCRWAAWTRCLFKKVTA